MAKPQRVLSRAILRRNFHLKNDFTAARISDPGAHNLPQATIIDFKTRQHLIQEEAARRLVPATPLR
jgi:hypothetical protein